MGEIIIGGKKQIEITIGTKKYYEVTIGGKVINIKPVVVDPNAWHFGDGASGPDLTKNDWKGSFSSPTKQSEFEALTTTITAKQFQTETSLKEVSIPKVTSIEAAAFQRCTFTELSIPKVTSVGGGCFQSSRLTSLSAPVIVDVGAGAFHGSVLTTLSLPSTTTIGTQAFYHSPLTNINVPKATTIGNLAFNAVANASSTEVSMNHKFNTTAEKDRIFGAGHWNNVTFHWLKDDGSPWTEPNSFTGTWSSPEQEAAFMAITDTVAQEQFLFETGITSITLPDVITLENGAFMECGSLSSIHVPKATTIGQFAFARTSSNLQIWMNKKFNHDVEKDRIFSSGSWNQITFHWTNDDGSPA